MMTRRTKPTNSDNMTAAMSADPSPDVVLQALLAHDLMAFTEFALRMSLISSAGRFSKRRFCPIARSQRSRHGSRATPT
jgi:hypothetical protein